MVSNPGWRLGLIHAPGRTKLEMDNLKRRIAALLPLEHSPSQDRPPGDDRVFCGAFEPEE